ncbi:MAG: hypothetical protein HY094_02525 [Candidatus Melainabacteria bacterium]|nr:hypothetical protein [Candidatus Melainabacteria bacterium]
MPQVIGQVGPGQFQVQLDNGEVGLVNAADAGQALMMANQIQAMRQQQGGGFGPNGAGGPQGGGGSGGPIPGQGALNDIMQRVQQATATRSVNPSFLYALWQSVLETAQRGVAQVQAYIAQLTGAGGQGAPTPNTQAPTAVLSSLQAVQGQAQNNAKGWSETQNNDKNAIASLNSLKNPGGGGG